VRQIAGLQIVLDRFRGDDQHAIKLEPLRNSEVQRFTTV